MITSASLTASISRSAGGLFESVRRLNQALSIKDEMEVLVFGLRDRHAVEDGAAWQPLALHTHPVIGPDRFGYAPGLADSIVQSDIDILHCHGIWKYPSLACLHWARKTKRPYLISPHGMLDPVDLAKSRWVKAAAKIIYQNAHLHGAACMRSLCDSETQSMLRFGLRNSICQIPNGVDLPELDLNTLAKQRAAKPKKHLLYLGRLNRKKGLCNLVEAWSLLRRQGSRQTDNWVLSIAGWSQNGHEDELKRQAAALGLDESIIFPGPQFGHDKSRQYQAADAFILPSTSEGLPMVVLEAWSHYLPVLMTPECNIPEGFTAGAAVRVNAEAADIARGLDELLSMSDAERQKLGRRGRQLVESQFTWPKVAAELRAVYRWLLGGGASPPSVRKN